MTDINLLQSEQEKKDSNGKLANVGLILPLGILIIVILAYAGLYFYTGFLDKKDTGLQSQILDESNKASKDDVNRVASFQNRMEKIDNGLSVANTYSDLFSQLENITVQGVNIASMEHTPTLLKLEMVTDNFFTVAKQILSFKNSDAFSDVKVAGIERDQSGKIHFNLELTPKTANK